MPLALLSLAHYLLCYGVWFWIFFHPARKGGRLSRPALKILFIAYGLLQCVLCLFVLPRYGYSLVALNHLKILGFACFGWLPFYAFPRRSFENLFILGLCGMFFAITFGFGNLGEWLLLPRPLWLRRACNVLITCLISLLLTPTFLAPLNQMFLSWQGEESAGMWKSFWMIPCAFVAMVLTCGNYTQPESMLRAEFVFSRVIICINLYILFYYINNAMRQSARTAALSERARLTGQQLALQRDQYVLLSEQIEQSRVARHDLRHQLTVLKGYADASDFQGMVAYLDEYTRTLPQEEAVYCEHYAVNALARHYAERAGREEVAMEMRLRVPEQTGALLDADLCVVMGNCLERALSASAALPPEGRWIHLRMWVHEGLLILWMRNAAAQTKTPSASPARVSQGADLSTIQAIARKYGDEATFWAEAGAFETLIQLPLSRDARPRAPRGLPD